MILDAAIANITTHYEAILNNTNCDIQKRRIPAIFMRRSRIPRSFFERIFKKFVKRTGKLLGWTTVLTTAGAIGSSTGVWVDHYLSRQDYLFMQEREKEQECKSFNSGCHDGRCWSNCGVRVNSADWCFTANWIGEVKNANLCKYDIDCDSCNACVSECFKDDIENE